MSRTPKDGTPFEKKCKVCDGSGEVSEDCERCGGEGTIDEDRMVGDVLMGAPWQCGNCSGSGKEMMTCGVCNGSGMVVDFFESEFNPEEI
jgi:DnaJ-class molecular chaperone